MLLCVSSTDPTLFYVYTGDAEDVIEHNEDQDIYTKNCEEASH